MSTSGISLGSLSSGQGINVQTTVASLIATMRTPETQWQNQEDQLTQQSSAFSQLGTMLATLGSKLDALRDVGGALAAKTATSSRTDLVNASADSTAATGIHTVTVDALAQTASWYSADAPSASTAVANGSFTLAVGGATNTITVDPSNDTVSSMAAYLNAGNYGVTASVVNDSGGSRLVLVSNTGGAAGDIGIQDSSGFGLTQGLKGQDASLTVDGVPLTSATNTVTGALQGVTLQLGGAAPGTAVQVAVAGDSSTESKAVQDFVTAYNSVAQFIDSQNTTDGSGNGGPLLGDLSLDLLQSQLLGGITFAQTDSAQSGSINSLADLGVTMNNDGTLSVDTSKLSTALSTDPSSVQSFFQTTGDFGDHLNGLLTTLNDPTEGPVGIAQTGIAAQKASLDDMIKNFEVYISSQQQILTDEYSQINAELQQMPMEQNSIAAQLGSLSNGTGK